MDLILLNVRSEIAESDFNSASRTVALPSLLNNDLSDYLRVRVVIVSK